MTVTSYSSAIGNVGLLTDLSEQLRDRQRQLGTGERSETYGGLGADRTVSVSTNQRIRQVEEYQSTIEITQIRLSVMDTALGGIEASINNSRGAILSGDFRLDGQTITNEQNEVKLYFDDILATLNTEADDRFIFSGKDVGVPSVQSSDLILEGDTQRTGLIDLIDQRRQADQGASGTGRLATATTATELTLAEDGAHGFGFKINAISTNIAGAAVAGPSGTPPSTTLTLGVTQPDPGDQISYELALPDGSTHEVRLTATDSATPGPGEFEIGATIAGTITNMEAALTASLQVGAETELEAASAISTALDFFAADRDNPPQRIVGAPYDTATASVAGTAADTVIWYNGDTGGSPRASNTARIDEGLVVEYGARANEESIQWTLAHMAVYSLTEYSDSDPNGAEHFRAVQDRVGEGLSYDDVQSVPRVRAEVAVAQIAIDNTLQRHREDLNFLLGLRESAQGVNEEQISAEMLTLQTRLELSYATTSRLSQLSLVNYL